MKKHFYFDLDGVLVDLSKNLARLDGYDDPVHWYINKLETEGTYMYPLAIERHIDDECFVTCQPMPYYEEMQNLINYLLNKGHKVSVLSSCMDQPYSDKIVKQKIAWLNRYYPTEMKRFTNVHIVKGSKLKINYIDENSFLIDDYLKTYNAFRENGMADQFIHYTNFEALKQKLIELNII